MRSRLESDIRFSVTNYVFSLYPTTPDIDAIKKEVIGYVNSLFDELTADIEQDDEQ